MSYHDLVKKKQGKGWHRDGQYKNKDYALHRAKYLSSKFDKVTVEEGSIGKAWGRKRKCYRVWVK